MEPSLQPLGWYLLAPPPQCGQQHLNEHSSTSMSTCSPAGQCDQTWERFSYKGMVPFQLFPERLCSAPTSLFFGSFSLVKMTTWEARFFSSFFQASGRRGQDPGTCCLGPSSSPSLWHPVLGMLWVEEPPFLPAFHLHLKGEGRWCPWGRVRNHTIGGWDGGCGGGP